MRIKMFLWAGILFALSGILSAKPCSAQQFFIVTNGKFAGETIVTTAADPNDATQDVVLADNTDQGAVGTVTVTGIPGSIPRFNGTERSNRAFSERVRNVPLINVNDVTDEVFQLNEAVMNNLRAWNLVIPFPPAAADFPGGAADLDAGVTNQNNAIDDLNLNPPPNVTQAKINQIIDKIRKCIRLDQTAITRANEARPNGLRTARAIIDAQACKRDAFKQLFVAENPNYPK
jgi:hypothetical protein